VEKFCSQVLFQLQELTTDGGLLDAVRHLARSSRNPSVPRHVVKKFKMMNIDSTSSV
jgi:hypothetical protein